MPFLGRAVRYKHAMHSREAVVSKTMIIAQRKPAATTILLTEFQPHAPHTWYHRPKYKNVSVIIEFVLLLSCGLTRMDGDLLSNIIDSKII